MRNVGRNIQQSGHRDVSHHLPLQVYKLAEDNTLFRRKQSVESEIFKSYIDIKQTVKYLAFMSETYIKIHYRSQKFFSARVLHNLAFNSLYLLKSMFLPFKFMDSSIGMRLCAKH